MVEAFLSPRPKLELFIAPNEIVMLVEKYSDKYQAWHEKDMKIW